MAKEKRIREMTEKLKEEYQPQWNFRTRASAKKELEFQRDMNPQTYRWLMKKHIKVGGKIISAKSIMEERHQTSSNDPLGMQDELRRMGY